MKTKPKTIIEYKGYEIECHEDGTWNTKEIQTGKYVPYLCRFPSMKDILDSIDGIELFEEISDENETPW